MTFELDCHSRKESAKGHSRFRHLSILFLAVTMLCCASAKGQDCGEYYMYQQATCGSVAGCTVLTKVYYGPQISKFEPTGVVYCPTGCPVESIPSFVNVGACHAVANAWKGLDKLGERKDVLWAACDGSLRPLGDRNQFYSEALNTTLVFPGKKPLL